MECLLQALALIMAVEGMCCALAPGLTQEALLHMASRSPREFRRLGAMLLLCAIFIACIVQRMR